MSLVPATPQYITGDLLVKLGAGFRKGNPDTQDRQEQWPSPLLWEHCP